MSLIQGKSVPNSMAQKSYNINKNKDLDKKLLI